MESVSLLLCFYLGGVFFANVLHVAHFMLLIIAVTVICLIYAVLTSNSLGMTWISVVLGFFTMQVGYVSGLGLRTAWARFFPGFTFLAGSRAIVQKEKIK